MVRNLKQIKRILQIALLLFITASAVAQYETVTLKDRSSLENIDFYHLKMPGGNEQNSINQFLQDTLGQMWIATKDGLVRYNGKKKYIYRSDPDNPNSIGHNFVTALFLDRNGTLWVGTQKGLTKYRPGSDDFIAASPELNDEYITDIQQDTSGNLWIINHEKNRLYSYNTATGELQLVADDNLSNEQGKPHMIWILIDTSNRFFITDMNYGFIRFFPESGTFRRYRLIDNNTEPSQKKLRNIFSKIIQDRDNPDQLWIGTNLGFLTGYNLHQEKQTRLVYNKKLTNHGFHCYNSDLYEDNNGNIWLTTWFYGTFKILPDRKTFEQFLPNPDDKHSISNSITTAIYQDMAGYLWFGTEYQGVDILKKNKKFDIFPTYPVKKDALPPAHYLSIIKDRKNRIWVGAEGGIYSLDKSNLKSTEKTGLFDGASRFFSLYYDPEDNLWAGTENGVYCLNNNEKVILHLTQKKDDYQSLSCNYISDITSDQQGNIWIGTFYAGLVKYNPHTGKYYRFMPDKSDPKSISHPYVKKIYIDNDEQIWVGTLDGLNKLNKNSGNFTIFKNEKTNPASISSSVINDINGSGDTLWIASQGGGLSLYDKKTQTFKNFTVKDGLPDNNVKDILIDDHHNLWLATTKNIVKFNPQTGQMVTYTESDGLENRLYVENMGWQTLNFDASIVYKDEQGYMYFGGSGGLLFFHPDSLPVNTYRSKLIIEKFSVNGKERKIDHNEITLQPNENQIEIEFTLMNLIQSGKNTYAWKLEPYDSCWQQGNHTSKAAYFNLPPGNYKLYYKAANNDGIWTVAPEPVHIIITPRFYQTTTFFLLITGVVLLWIFGFIAYRWYLKKQLEKKRKLMRYSWSNLDKTEARKINKKLLTVMQNKNIYLEPDLNLNKLADIIIVKPNYLSQVINQFHQQNFYEFINTYRIEEAKRLLRETTLKVEAVAYDSGFNSLSTFNSVFKKTTQMTPSQYRRKHSDKKEE
jgi:ligand-binding sensor domain-containing protein/AraC-like DNA-binding protein